MRLIIGLKKMHPKNSTDELVEYVKKNGRFLGVLPFGSSIYDIKEMSISIDSDCMSQQPKDTYKYLILQRKL